MARAFDPALLSLPFNLPVSSIESVVELYPDCDNFGLSMITVSSRAEVDVVCEQEDVAYRHIGIIGGPGSSSSLGSKARNLPTAKYGASGKDAPEQASAPVVMGLAADTSIGLAGAAMQDEAPRFDSALLARDLAILCEDGDNWESLLAPGLPDVPVHLDGETASAVWWFDSEYTRALALAHGAGMESGVTPLQAVADLLGMKNGVRGSTHPGAIEPDGASSSPSTVSALMQSGAPANSAQADDRSGRTTQKSVDIRAVNSSGPLSTAFNSVSVRARFWGDVGMDQPGEGSRAEPSTGAGVQDAGSRQLDALEAELRSPLPGEGDGEDEGQAQQVSERSPASAHSPADIAAQIRAQIESSSTVTGLLALQRGAHSAAQEKALQKSQVASTHVAVAMPTAAVVVPETLSGQDIEALVNAVADATDGVGAGSTSSVLQIVRQKMGAGEVISPHRTWAVVQRMTPAELTAAEATFRPAYTWPFPLDSFQRESIAHMEVEGPAAALFVAAHTSAGKTVVAEYACAKAMATRTRAVYTSPIKALSNQKYRDLKEKFGGPDGKGVGLITGDVSVNPEAPVLIMTTEILRSMCYRGDELVRDVSWVVFDEVHYINDAERGLAYEEVLLLLPETAGLVFLSATSPNREEFAEWVGRTKRKRVYVLGTDKRPVPLMHYIFSQATDGPAPAIKDKQGCGAGVKGGTPAIHVRVAAAVAPAQGASANMDLTAGLPLGQGPLHLIMDGAAVDGGDSRNGLKSGNYTAAADRLSSRIDKRGGAGRFGPSRSAGAGRSGGGRSKAEQQTWRGLLGVLQAKELLPCIVFAFSKAKCEECAHEGLGAADLTSGKEKSAIHIFFETALRRLAPADRVLPQLTRMRGLLLRGIGVHHSGLLPILKECVEMLFARGLVKILFATETFAMGVNFPARTVVFNGIRKHDGTAFRDLTPGEYIQMAGRAGRRGLDTRGVVIVLTWGEALPELSTLQSMLLGKPSRLSSSFRLTYNMILNVLRTDIPVTHMMARSYAEFASQRALGGRDIPRLLAAGMARLAQLQKESDRSPCIVSGSRTVDSGVLQAASGVMRGSSHSPASLSSLASALDIEDLAVAGLHPGAHDQDLEGALDVHRNAPGIRAFVEAADAAQEAHMALLRCLISHAGGKGISSLLPPGRVVVVDGVHVPWPGSQGDRKEGLHCGNFVLSFAPAVVLSAERRELPISSTDSAPAIDVDLTILVLCPPGYDHVHMTSGAPQTGGGMAIGLGVPSLAPLSVGTIGLQGQGMMIISKGKGGDDDDLDSMMGKGKGKSKQGGNKGKGAAGFDTPASSSSATQALGAQIKDKDGPKDGPVSTGHFHFVATNMGGPGGIPSARTPAILRVSLRHIARVTGLSTSTIRGRNSTVDAVAQAVVAGVGSTQALATTACALASIVQEHGADVFSARMRVLQASGAQPDKAAAAVKLAFRRTTMLTPQARLSVAAKAFNRHALLLPCIDPTTDMSPPAPHVAAYDAFRQAQAADARFAAAINAEQRSGTQSHPAAKCSACPVLGHSWRAASGVARLAGQLAAVRAKFSVESMALYPEMQVRFGILKRLGYTKSGAEQPDNMPPADDRKSQSRPALDIVALKGRVAAEVNTCDELLFAEMVFDGLAAALSPAELAAMLSALVFQEKSGRAGDEADAAMSVIHAAAAGAGTGIAQSSKGRGEEEAQEVVTEADEVPVDATPGYADEPTLTQSLTGDVSASVIVDGKACDDGDSAFESGADVSPEAYDGPLVHCIPQHLAQACLKLYQVALALGRLQMEAGLEIVPSAYAKSALNFGLLLPTYAWACGVPFVEICRLTDVAEGSIVRCISRLDETLRELRNSARIVGDPTLFRKAETASAAIKRDVIFAASLYHS